jgi:ribose transport system permease protein
MNDIMAQIKNKWFSLPKGFNSLIGLIAIVIILTILSPAFLTLKNLSNVLVQAAVVAILASGMTLVIITGGIDLSVGTVMTLASCTMGILMINKHFGVVPSLLVALVVGAFSGFVNGIIIAKGRIQPFVVTLGTMGIAQGFALMMTAGYSLYGFPDSFTFIGGGQILNIPVPILIVAIVYVVMFLVLEYSKLGRYAFAIGGNEEATNLAGINVNYYKIFIYAINGLLAGLAGIVLSARICSAHPGLGSGFEMDAIAATVIGGTSLMGGQGTMIGTIIGALIMATIKNGLNLLGISSFLQKVALGCIIIVAVLMDQAGRSRA